MKNYIVLLSATAMLAGCSTITTGTTQLFGVDTPYADGASCELKDSRGSMWNIAATPGTAEVTKGDGPMTVSCNKAGFKSASIQVEEGLAGMTFGNVLLGGGIGIVVDSVSGAAQEYPDRVTVWLEPESFANAEEEAEWRGAKEAFEAEQKAEAEALKEQQNNGEYSRAAGNQ